METGNLLLFAGLAFVVVFSILVYVVLMIFFPEWVGITGPAALRAEQSHKEGSAAPPDILSFNAEEPKKPEK